MFGKPEGQGWLVDILRWNIWLRYICRRRGKQKLLFSERLLIDFITFQMNRIDRSIKVSEHAGFGEDHVEREQQTFLATIWTLY